MKDADGMSSELRISGLVLAAGSGERFGGPKQLAEFDGEPLVLRAARQLLYLAAIQKVAVTVGAQADAVESALAETEVELIPVAGWEEGMAASLRAGIAALRDSSDAVVVTLADQPLVTTDMVAAVLDAWDGEASAVRAVHDGIPGHPVLIGSRLFDSVDGLSGDVGAKALLGTDTLSVECGRGSILDADTPQQLDDLLGSTG